MITELFFPGGDCPLPLCEVSTAVPSWTVRYMFVDDLTQTPRTALATAPGLTGEVAAARFMAANPHVLSAAPVGDV